jgi:hypothetical protein
MASELVLRGHRFLWVAGLECRTAERHLRQGRSIMRGAALLPTIGKQGGNVLGYALMRLRCERSLHRVHLRAQLFELRVLLGRDDHLLSADVQHRRLGLTLLLRFLERFVLGELFG